MESNKTICYCMSVDEATVRQAIANGAHTVEAIGEQTGAGTVCRACVPQLQKMIDEQTK